MESTGIANVGAAHAASRISVPERAERSRLEWLSHSTAQAGRKIADELPSYCVVVPTNLSALNWLLFAYVGTTFKRRPYLLGYVPACRALAALRRRTKFEDPRCIDAMSASIASVAPAVDGTVGGDRPTRTVFPAPVGRFLDRHQAFRALAIVIVCILCLRILLEALDRIVVANGIAVYWPVSGIVVAVLLLSGRSFWPWVMLGFIISDISIETGTVLARAIIVAGDTLEILIAAFLLPAFLTFDSWMQERALMRRFSLYVLLLGSLSCSVPISLYHSLALHEGFWFFLVRWAAADALGMSLGLPLVLTLCSRETYRLFRSDAIVETAGLMGLVCAASWAIFYHFSYSTAFMVLPILLLIAFRLGFSGSVIAVNLVALISSLATLNGRGPFHLGPSLRGEYGIVLLQIFLIFSMLICLPVTMVLLERKQFERQLRDACEQLRLITMKDALTGIANRRCFDETIDREWRRAARNRSSISLLMIDVDQFKHFNDSFGHVEGDECLCRVAAAISSELRRITDLTARYGGEEFAVVMPNMNLVGTERVAGLIRAAVASMELAHTGSLHGKVTVSIGCAVEFPVIGTEPTSLILAADKALYSAKQRGRNRIESSDEIRNVPELYRASGDEA